MEASESLLSYLLAYSVYMHIFHVLYVLHCITTLTQKEGIGLKRFDILRLHERPAEDSLHVCCSHFVFILKAFLEQILSCSIASVWNHTLTATHKCVWLTSPKNTDTPVTRFTLYTMFKGSDKCSVLQRITIKMSLGGSKLEACCWISKLVISFCLCSKL